MVPFLIATGEIIDTIIYHLYANDVGVSWYPLCRQQVIDTRYNHTFTFINKYI